MKSANSLPKFTSQELGRRKKASSDIPWSCHSSAHPGPKQLISSMIDEKMTNIKT